MNPILDPYSAGILSMGAGLLGASGPSQMPVSLGQALGGGMQGGLAAMQRAQALQQQQQLQNAQIGHLSNQDAMLAQQLKMAKLESGMLQGVLGRMGGSQQPSGKPMEGGMSLPGSSGAVSPQSGGLGLPNDVSAMLLFPRTAALGKELAKVHAPTDKMREATALGIQPGTPQWNAFVGTQYNQGGAWQPNANGGVSLAPGYAEGMGQVKEAEARTGARFAEPVTLNLPGGPRTMTREQAADMLSGGAQNPAVPNPASQAPVRMSAPNRGAAIQQASQLDSQNVPFSVSVAAPSGPGVPVKSEAQLAADKKLSEGGAQQQLDKPKASAAIRDALSNIDRMESDVDALLKDKNLSFSVGVGSPLSMLPGTPFAGVRARLETLKSQIITSTLQAMRAASPTGGALGPVSDRENQMLANNLAALQAAQSPNDLRYALGQIKQWAAGSRGRLGQAFKDTYGEDVSPADPVPAGKVVDFGSLK